MSARRYTDGAPAQETSAPAQNAPAPARDAPAPALAQNAPEAAQSAPAPAHAASAARENARRLVFATSFPARLRGLIARDRSWLPPGTELVFLHCNRVHTHLMREVLDIAFADEHGTVLQVERDVFPGRTLGCRKAAMTIERFAPPPSNAGVIAWYEKGDDTGIAIATAAFLFTGVPPVQVPRPAHAG